MDVQSTGVSPEEIYAPLRALGGQAKFSILILDQNKRIIFANSAFEDMTGIRADSAIGQDVASVARDQSFAPFINDLMDRSSHGLDSASEDTDFSGVQYRCTVSAFGSPPKCYVFYAMRGEG